MPETADAIDMRSHEEQLDALLGEARNHIIEERKANAVSLPALLGEYEPVEGHPGFYARAPKLRQQIEMAKVTEAAQAQDQTTATVLAGTAELLRFALYKRDFPRSEEFRQVTLDEILDEFDMGEMGDLVGKYLGFKAGGSDPNAVAG
jgi:hypothetical protein